MAKHRVKRRAQPTAPIAGVARRAARTVEERCAYAHTQHLQGNLNGALAAYTAALNVSSTHSPALHGLGLVCHQVGRHADAVALLRRACELAPRVAEYHNNLGTVLAAMRQFDAAIVCHHHALGLDPALAEAHNNLGNALREIGQPEEALVCFERAIMLKPTDALAYLNLGTCLRTLRRLPEAIAAYEAARDRAPQMAEVHNNLGTAYKESGRWDLALSAYRAALERLPDLALAHYNLGTALYQLGHLEAAQAALIRAIELDPALPEAQLNLGNIAKDQGRLDDALSRFRQALAMRADYSAAHSNLLFTMNYVDGVSQQEIFDLHVDFNRRHAASYAAESTPHHNPRDCARRLKIGYISPDFRAHACAYFVQPILAHHDHRMVEVYAYAEVANPDAVTRNLAAHCDHWRSTVGLTDAQVAALIRADGIDVLIDLAGHTANSRILALARKPAPVQVTYLGYPATTGLETMDYRITDAVTEPAGQSERYYTETLVRLPNSLWCYEPFPDMPQVSSLPALTNGYLTFGSFNNFAKVGPRVIELWAQILLHIPSARLAMLCAADAETQARVSARFARHGVEGDRLQLYGRDSRAAYLQRFARCDIALDPFPCNGGTTTCDALWMGLPVVALIGETFLSRASFSVLHAAGFAEDATRSPTEYLAHCVRLSEDLPRLAARRATMRAQLASSPLRDAAGFTLSLEHLYRSLWRRWCEEPV